MSEVLIIPPAQLSQETLENLVQEFVTRDGTDYGVEEVAVTTKVQQVIKQLQCGQAVIVYDSQSDTCTIVPAQDAAILTGSAQQE